MFTNTRIPRLLLAACLATGGISLQSCVEKKSNTFEQVAFGSAQQMVPALLTRNASIGSPEEQAKTQAIYQELKQAILSNPEDYTSRLKLAQLFMLEARATGEHGYYYPATLGVLDQLIEANPAEDVTFGAYSLRASVLLSLHQFEAARKAAEYAISLNGYNALIYGSLVDANVELGHYEEAVKMSDKMNSIRPDLRSYSRVSYLREIYGDLDGAIEAMNMAAESGYPGFEETAWCRLTLGGLYEKKGDLKTAKAHYERILQERADYPFAIAALGRVADKEGNPALAETLLKEAIDIIPEVAFYEDLAALYLKTGREAESQLLVKEILTMLQDDEQAGHVMKMAYSRVYLELKNDPKKALDYALEEYRERPDNIEVNQLLAEIYLKLDDLEQAKAHLAVATRTNASNPDLMCIEGIAKAWSFQLEEAQQLVSASFELDPYQDHLFVKEARKLLQD
ncbi:MAG: hypothetical protein NWR72_01095 [Bacteroidia bacterium]|nr:hypothetical protein [Bacteroidia bacterium]